MTGGAPQQADPEQMKQTLVSVLQEVSRVAEQNGLSFQELVSLAARGGASPRSVPPPPV